MATYGHFQSPEPRGRLGVVKDYRAEKQAGPDAVMVRGPYDDVWWHRQPFDSDLQWAAFLQYRDSNPRPSFPELQRTMHLWTGQEIPAERLRAWSKRNHWAKRCAALDNYRQAKIDATRDSYLDEQASVVAERHLDVLRRGIDLAAESLNRLLEKSAQLEHSNESVLSPREITQLLTTAIKLERLTRGEVTERVEDTGLDLSTLSLEELQALKALQQKARKA